MWPSFRVWILWLHLLGVVIWIGGLVFQWLVVRPACKRLTSVREQVRMRLSLEARFYPVLWPAVGVVLFTGLVNLMSVWSATVALGGSLPPVFVRFLSLKLLLVLAMVILQAVQHVVLQPRRLALLGSVPVAAATLPHPLARAENLAGGMQALTLTLAAMVFLCALLLRG
jgi:uncharacterized membrane protein